MNTLNNNHITTEETTEAVEALQKLQAENAAQEAIEAEEFRKAMAAATSHEAKMALIKERVFEDAPITLLHLANFSKQGVVSAIAEAMRNTDQIKKLNLPENVQFSIEFNLEQEKQFVTLYFYTINPDAENCECAQCGADCACGESEVNS